MSVGHPRPKTCRFSVARASSSRALAFAVILLGLPAPSNAADAEQLSYAAHAEQQAPAAIASPLSAPTALPAPPAATTIAIKRTGDQAYSTIVAAPPKLTAGSSSPAASSPAGSKDIPGNNPWLDAVMLSPSIDHLTALALGEPDYLSLTPLVEKPTQTVPMTFSDNPTPGLAPDHFTGSAVVFMSTVTYQRQNLALH